MAIFGSNFLVHPKKNRDRHQLVQQVQRIGSGALGTQAATAVRHVAAQNGVWSLGNFGGVPPKSAMMYHQPSGPTADETSSSPDAVESTLSNSIAESDYRHVFNSCTVGMVRFLLFISFYSLKHVFF